MNIIKKWTESSLILKIVIGLIIGAILGILVPSWKFIGFPGELFVSALKAIAPLLVFVLVASAISKAKRGIGDRFKTVIILYIFTTFLSAMVAVAGIIFSRLQFISLLQVHKQRLGDWVR